MKLINGVLNVPIVCWLPNKGKLTRLTDFNDKAALTSPSPISFPLGLRSVMENIYQLSTTNRTVLHWIPPPHTHTVALQEMIVDTFADEGMKKTIQTQNIAKRSEKKNQPS